MAFSRKIKALILILGDFSLLYISLYLTLLIRYQEMVRQTIWDIHQKPFFYIHILWILIFYIGGLYDITGFTSFKRLFDRILKTMAAAGLFATLIFYLTLTPEMEIAPKTNLFIDIVILTILLVFWRKLYWTIMGKSSKIKTLFFGGSKEVKSIASMLQNNPHLGYDPAVVLSETNSDLIGLVKEKGIHLIVASKEMMQDENHAKQFYSVLPLGVTIIDFPGFYETLTEKIPVSIINETWFLENLFEINKKNFELTKRILDITLAILLGIPTIFLIPIIALLIKLESKGAVFYKQLRVGKNGRVFKIIKFRSMIKDAEKNKSGWTKPDGKDNRVTRIGSVLRKTRLDELPQLWNVLKGEMSFIGPRPERPEFIEDLEKEIPHYAMRHLIKPGLSGWAQIKFPYNAAAEDAMEKLQYDLFYLKNRSLTLDLAIALKTLTAVISKQGK